MQETDDGQNLICISKAVYFISVKSTAEAINKSTYGKIMKAERRPSDGKMYAIKMQPKQKDTIEYFQREKRIMEELVKYKPRHLIYLEDYAEDAKYIYLVMPLMDHGDLGDYVNRFVSGIPECQLIEFMREVLEGMYVMTKHLNITHRDIKPANVFLRYPPISPALPFEAVLGDYGSAKDNQQMNTGIGTYDYMAPEILSSLPYNEQVDIYSFGAMYYYLLFKDRPFKLQNVQMIEERKQTRFHLPRPCSSFSAHIIEGCLQYDPINRITIDKLCSIMNVNPSKPDNNPLFIFPFNKADQTSTINLLHFTRKEMFSNLEEPLMKSIANSINCVSISKELKMLFQREITKYSQPTEPQYQMQCIPNIVKKEPIQNIMNKEDPTVLFGGDIKSTQQNNPNQLQSAPTVIFGSEHPLPQNMPIQQIPFDMFNSNPPAIPLIQNQVNIYNVPQILQYMPPQPTPKLMIVTKHKEKLMNEIANYKYFNLREKYGCLSTYMYTLWVSSNIIFYTSLGNQ
jgi:serine/threonine protein kinase